MRAALFGGSFDPPHCGHLKIARAAKEALALDTILMAPVGSQPLKTKLRSTPFQQRYEMVSLALREEEGMEASDIDAPRPDGSPNYTFDTIEKLKGLLPEGADLFFLMGADSLQTLKFWHRAKDLLLAADFIIAARPGFSFQELQESMPEGLIVIEGGEASSPSIRSLTIKAEQEERSSRIHLLPDLRENVSATAVRAALREGKAERVIVPRAVLDYIRKQGLYQEELDFMEDLPEI